MGRELCARHRAEGSVFEKDPGVGTVIISISRVRKPSGTEAVSLAEGPFCNELAACMESRFEPGASPKSAAHLKQVSYPCWACFFI